MLSNENILTIYLGIASFLVGVVYAALFYARRTRSRDKSYAAMREKEHDSLDSARRNFNTEKSIDSIDFKSNANVAASLYNEIVRR